MYNCALGGTTMRSDLVNNYQACNKWLACLANKEKYDLVLISLGGNDSNRIWQTGRTWDEQDDAVFKSSAREIIDRVKQHSPNAEFVIMNCVVCYGYQEFSSERIRDLQREIADNLKKENYKMHFYDMYTYTSQVLDSSRFPDQLHPDNKGHFLMAQGVVSMLKALASGETLKFLLY